FPVVRTCYGHRAVGMRWPELTSRANTELRLAICVASLLVSAAVHAPCDTLLPRLSIASPVASLASMVSMRNYRSYFRAAVHCGRYPRLPRPASQSQLGRLRVHR